MSLTCQTITFKTCWDRRSMIITTYVCCGFNRMNVSGREIFRSMWDVNYRCSKSESLSNVCSVQHTCTATFLATPSPNLKINTVPIPITLVRSHHTTCISFSIKTKHFLTFYSLIPFYYIQHSVFKCSLVFRD